MRGTPEAAATSLARGVGAYIRSVKAEELPGPLRRYQSFTAKGLTRHRAALIGALDDVGLRARIIEWVDGGKHKLSKKDADLLRIASERAEGWEERLSHDGAGVSRPAPPEAPAGVVAQREKERAKRAREELRRVKEATRGAIETERANSARLRSRVQELETQLAAVERKSEAARKAVTKAEADLERERRKARAALQKKENEKKELRRTLKTLRDELRALKVPTGGSPKKTTARRKTAQRPKAPEARAPLGVPKGRFETDPETLDSWLGTSGVHLLVDGYNVTKAEGGYGDLELETQRERLVDGVGRLARKKKIKATIVFDGSEVAPGTARRGRSPVTVEYSRPGETADDHLVARLESMPGDPVVVVTNDRELKGRASARGATTASSQQLLSLLR